MKQERAFTVDEGSIPSVPTAPSPNGKASGFGSDYCRFESDRGCKANGSFWREQDIRQSGSQTVRDESERKEAK